jgi:hypothetical protein
MVQGFGSNLDFLLPYPIFYFHFEPLLWHRPWWQWRRYVEFYCPCPRRGARRPDLAFLYRGLG